MFHCQPSCLWTGSFKSLGNVVVKIHASEVGLSEFQVISKLGYYVEFESLLITSILPTVINKDVPKKEGEQKELLNAGLSEKVWLSSHL